MTNAEEVKQLRDRIAAKAQESADTVAAKRLLALDVARGNPLANTHYATLCKAQAEIDRDVEILNLAADALSAPPESF